MNNLGLYVHIPFCKAKCGYCDFNSYANKGGFVKPYFSALEKELSLSAERYPRSVDTLYFGGGTPTFVDAEFICQMVDLVKEKFEQCSNFEVTAECNPGTVGYEGLFSLRQAGVNRLSIGLQSAEDRCLKALGRIHSVEDFERCFSDARRAGFSNISLDLMYGLPDQTMEDWRKTLRCAADFGTEHISCYALKIEEGTPFSKMSLNLPDEDAVADMYEEALGFLGRCGYERYEISNFAKKGFESRHNMKYWKCHDFLGVGAGAFSCVDGERFSNVCAVEEYIERIEKFGSACEEREALDSFDKMSEFVFLGLRLSGGISEKEFEKKFSLNIDEIFGKPLKKYTEMGFLERNGGKIRFSDKGFFVSNTILSDFV